MGTPEAEVMAGVAFTDRALSNVKRAKESMKSYAQRTKLFCASLTGYTNQMMQVFEDVEFGMEDLKSFDEAHIEIATKTLERMTNLFDELVLNPLNEWSEAVKLRKKECKGFLDVKKKRDHYEKKINGIKDKLAKGKVKVEYLRKNEEKLKQWKQQYAAIELKAVEKTRKFRLEHCKIMRTIVARLIQFETQLFKELGNATGKLDGAVKNLLNHSELEKSLRQGSFKLKESDCQGSEESALEQRLSEMEKRFDSFSTEDAAGNTTDHKPKMQPKPKKDLPKKPKSRKSLKLVSEPTQEDGAEVNAGWDADSFPSSGTADDDDWGFSDASNRPDGFAEGFNTNADFNGQDAFGTGWDTDSPNIMSSNESFTNDINAKTSDMVSGNGQSHISEFDDPWNPSPNNRISNSVGNDSVSRNNSTDAWPSPAAAAFSTTGVSHHTDVFSGNSNQTGSNMPEVDAFGLPATGTGQRGSGDFGGDDFGFSGTPNNNFGDNVFGTMNNDSSSTTSNAMQGKRYDGDDLFGVSSMPHNGDKTNGSGMDMLFGGPISTGSSNSHPAKPMPRNDANNGSGGSNNPFLDF
eukprot:g10566.t1